MYRRRLNFTHLESHKAKVITILLQLTLHRNSEHAAAQHKRAPDKKYICSHFEFHIKNTYESRNMRERGSREREREREQAMREEGFDCDQTF